MESKHESLLDPLTIVMTAQYYYFYFNTIESMAVLNERIIELVLALSVLLTLVCIYKNYYLKFHELFYTRVLLIALWSGLGGYYSKSSIECTDFFIT